MIAIINKRGSGATPGKFLYYVEYGGEIGRLKVCEFWHMRSDGMAKCLELASEAVKMSDMDTLARLSADSQEE
jgi:hypothetical protein